MLLLEPCRTARRLTLGTKPVVNVLTEGRIGQCALELIPRGRLQDDPRILSEVPQYWVQRAPQSVGGMIPRPMHIQGEFRQGIEPLDFRGHYHVLRMANICVCVFIIPRSAFHDSPWMFATSAGLRFISTAVTHLGGTTRLHLHTPISVALQRDEPVPRLGGMGVIEVADFCRGERLAEYRHSFFPFILANDRQPFDVIEVFRVELDVLPQRAPCPTMKVIELHKHQELAVLFDQPLHGGQKGFRSLS